MTDVLLVEPWFGGSHRGWAEGVHSHSKHDVSLLTLPDEAWRWRMRGGAITLAGQVETCPDVVLASSLVDLPSFLAHARIEGVPAVLYMHENQLTYPLPEGARRDMGLAFTNWSSAVRADRVLFNSDHHRGVFFDAATSMLRSVPEPRHDELIEVVMEKSSVVPVGVEMGWIDDAVAKTNPPLIVWNQRWEHDKDPDTLTWALGELIETGAGFRVALCGEAPFSQTPDSLASLPDLLGDRLVQFGHAERPTYEAILREASVVVSTARHEFFGVAVVEAMAAGARPVLPNRLSYPELIPGRAHAQVLYGSRAELVAMLGSAVEQPASPPGVGEAARQFDWRRVIGMYDRVIDELT